MKFYIADAFTETIFWRQSRRCCPASGRRDFPSDALMVKTAAELRYSETAFIKRLSEKEFQIRYFTPAAEVDLCGHATIASFKVLLHAGIIHDNDTYLNHTLAGDLNIACKDGFVLMDMAAPVKIGEITQKSALDELYKVMGTSTTNSLPMGLTSAAADDFHRSAGHHAAARFPADLCGVGTGHACCLRSPRAMK